MPHGNRMSSSDALKTNDIWTKTIGYDPYANASESVKQVDAASEEQQQGLMLMARLNNVKNGMGHFMCRFSLISASSNCSLI
jgi:hypothetical protein